MISLQQITMMVSMMSLHKNPTTIAQINGKPAEVLANLVIMIKALEKRISKKTIRNGKMIQGEGNKEMKKRGKEMNKSGGKIVKENVSVLV